MYGMLDWSNMYVGGSWCLDQAICMWHFASQIHGGVSAALIAWQAVGNA
jgi:hypothetical protein